MNVVSIIRDARTVILHIFPGLVANLKANIRNKTKLRELAPESFEKFIDIKYNNLNTWENLKKKFRVLNMYKVDNCSMTAERILEMDWTMITEKPQV